jgi:hypothetical protein
VWNQKTTADGLATADVQDLGARILRAARLATAAHLYGSLFERSSVYGQRVEIGGAGPVSCEATHVNIDLCVTEDALSATAGVVETHQSRRPSREVGDPFGGPGSPL